MNLLVSDRTAGKYRNVTMTGQQLYCVSKSLPEEELRIQGHDNI
jgi:hypothetical protein